MGHDISKGDAPLPKTSMALHMRPERKLIRKNGDACALDLSIQVEAAPVQEAPARSALRLALVLDRSGSMQGNKLQIAKRATLAVLGQLTERDSVSVVVFDSQIDVVQSAAQVTPTLKKQVQAALEKIEARASTALHEGWLTGCNSLVNDAAPSSEDALSRCFLLTDGLANVGITDPEQIASEAAGVREHTRISTSTFGIGTDYNESITPANLGV